MSKHTLLTAAFILALAGLTPAQSILFDFDTAPIHTSLPVTVSAGGLTATLSATGQGFSIQQAGVLGFTPVGFSGNCIYPNSVYAADLIINFSAQITDFSILYCSQDLGCDHAARMRATAYAGGSLIGTNTATAACPDSCTWPTQTLPYSNPAGFDRVVVHWDGPGLLCQDYGSIFLADNMLATPKPVAACRPDFNNSGAVTVQDIFDFLAAWFNADPRADFNGANGVTVQDIFDFLSAWFSGC